jgi:chromosome segregation ATPase
MDPLSITTSVLALLGICVSVCSQLRKVKHGAGEAKARIGALLNDVDNLRHVLQAMEATLDDLEAKDIFQNTGHIGAHWHSLHRSLDDGRNTLVELEEMLTKLDKETLVLDGARRYLRLKESTEAIAEYRQHVQSYRDAIQFSLQTVTLYGCRRLERWRHADTSQLEHHCNPRPDHKPRAEG